jgi:uncharacterized protein YodC (DUF2158 family)
MELEKTVSRTFNEYPDYEVGDIVRLKSGGPNMTVDNCGGSWLDCAWFDVGGAHHRQPFSQGSLEKVPTKDPDLSPA